MEKINCPEQQMYDSDNKDNWFRHPWSPDNIPLTFWVKIDHVLLQMIMIDSCGTVRCWGHFNGILKHSHKMWSISAIIEFDEQKEVLKIAGYMELTWTDEFLRWDPSNYGDVQDFFIVSLYE